MVIEGLVARVWTIAEASSRNRRAVDTVIGLALVLSVEWFIGMAHAVGNCVATVVVAAWEGDLDRARARAVLAHPGADPTGLGW